MKKHETVDFYIQNAGQWRDELIRLRKILNETGFEETVKWGVPCYIHAGKDVVGLGASGTPR